MPTPPAVPKASLLIGAVILAVVNRLMGREMSHRELFHGVLRLEQTLTTGGGWQDQKGEQECVSHRSVSVVGGVNQLR